MQRILCPTDFSDAAYNAVSYAAKFAQVTNSELILFHAESIFNLTPVEIIRGKEMTITALNEQLETQCIEISKTFKISCYAEVKLSGQSLSSIIEQKSVGFDLILMGTNGVSDYYDFFTGTNTYQVIKKSGIPVLLIPANCEYSSIDKITFAADLMKGDYIPLRKLVDWANLLKCKICILQVIREHYNHDIEVALKRTQEEISDFYSDEVIMEFDTIWSNEIASSIHSYILRTESDALVLCTGHRSFIKNLFHKSVTKIISSIASYPVFVFH